MLGINNSLRKITYYENILEFKEINKEDLSLSEINNWKFCRTCLADTNENDINMENMSILDAMNGTILNIKQMLVNVTSINISENENLPLQVCNTCFNKITELYYFCIQIRKAEKVISRLANRIKYHTKASGLCEANNIIEAELQEYGQDVETINISIDKNEAVQDELLKHEIKEPPELFEEFADSEAILPNSEEETIFDNEEETLFIDKEAQLENHFELKSSSSDEESHLESNFIEYLDTQDDVNEDTLINSATEANEIYNSELKETKVKGTGYRHKQPRVTSPLLDDFDCAICQISFGRQQDLVQHVRDSHPNSKAYRCRVCGNFFSHIQSLSRHMNSHKDSVILNECKYCSKSFVRADDLKRHVRVHTGERPYVCSKCEKSFQQQSDLKYHQKKHDYEEKNIQPKFYECNQCMKAYTSRTGINWHKKRHHNQKIVLDLKYHTARQMPRHTSKIQGQKENENFTMIDDED